MTPIDETWYIRPEGVRERVGAGGMVLRLVAGEPRLALVKEVELGDDHFVLPKGGIEAGEDILAAARREIAEESGLTELHHLGGLGAVEHLNFKRTTWQVSHYLLFATTQRDGVITDPANYGLAWFDPRDLPPMFWPAERNLVVEKREWMLESLQAWAHGDYSSS